MIISTAELEKYFGKEATPAKMKEQIICSIVKQPARIVIDPDLYLFYCVAGHRVKICPFRYVPPDHSVLIFI